MKYMLMFFFLLVVGCHLPDPEEKYEEAFFPESFLKKCQILHGTYETENDSTKYSLYIFDNGDCSCGFNTLKRWNSYYNQFDFFKKSQIYIILYGDSKLPIEYAAKEFYDEIGIFFLSIKTISENGFHDLIIQKNLIVNNKTNHIIALNRVDTIIIADYQRIVASN